MSETRVRSYEDLVLDAQLADYAPVRGCMVIRPYGYAIWENIQTLLNSRFRKLGIENACFPTLIPESFLQREKDHVEGFSPQCAVVTHGGGKLLEEPLVLRPTSETIINEMYAKWIRSYRDLPLLINQWANVFRWELRTKIFLRTLEFLWQEGHTAHETADEARAMTLQMLKVYEDFLREDLALFCIPGEKTERERFAGAQATYSVEILLRDGKALQAGTSHDLGTNFAKAFHISFQDRNRGTAIPFQTSWGMSTRLIGAIILGHQDEKGLILPPRVAGTQVVVIPIGVHQENRIMEIAQRVTEDLCAQGIRAICDSRDHVTPGWKFNEYELKGVPVRLEIGKRDLEREVFTVVKRPSVKDKSVVSIASVVTEIPKMLADIQKGMWESHRQFTQAHTFYPKTFDEFRQMVNEKGGFYHMYWDGDPNTEERIQQDTKATIRCIPTSDVGMLQTPHNSHAPLLASGKQSTAVILAKSY